MDTDRNLLYGVLALQAGLIDPTQFVEACTLWSARKSQSLADLLIEQGWLLPTDKVHLDYLLERKLNKHGGEAKASLGDLGDDIKRSLAALGDAEIQQSLANLPQPNAAAPGTTIDEVPGAQERYSLSRLHATGGIGRVWLAHDSDLGREVALKELRPEKAENAAHWTRFLREARITGQLEHPGIVPVYELGRRPENQQPYYTMRFVKGRTLTKAAQSYHQKRLAGQAKALDFLTLLNAFVAVCNTVAYAHSRGVIHRDLKGQNVVLGDFGEVVVLDWGLAKRVDRPDSDSAAPFPRVDLENPSEVDLTMQGQMIGTPAYMAPEQAAGRLDLIDHRTDVYGLGAILYEILTGQPPFTGLNTAEVLRKVREVEPLPPRQLCRDAPPALEAVCLRALAKHPADRPTTAADLAMQIQGWQEFERRKAEEALRDSEALYHSLVESLPCVVLRKDLEGRFTFANRRFCDDMGRPADQLLGKTDFDIVSRDLAEKYRRDDKQVMATGGVFEDIEEYIGPKGKHYVHTLKTVVRDAAGNIAGIQAIAWDVTARKLAEEELRKSRERFELAVLGSQDGLWDWDLETGALYLSPWYKSALGWEEHEFPKSIAQWDGWMHPEDREQAVGARQAHLEGRIPYYESEHRLLHRDGSYRWVRSRGVALRTAAGRAYRVAGSIEDVSERRRAEEALRDSEERYRSVIAAMQDGIVLLEADGSIRACNASAERILGLSAEQIRGRTALDPAWRAIHEDGSPFPADTFPVIMSLRTGKPCFNVIMGVHKPNGELTWISINSQPLFRPKEKTPYAALATFSDITDRREP